MNTPEYKFCKDCAHFMTASFEVPRCRIAHIKPDLVTGEGGHQFCSVERIGEGGCGEAGKNFQPKTQ